MCKVQVKAKNERQNDDYATANTNPNSSSHHDEAHHIRRRLSQTISSRYCLLIAIAFASLSAHACDDTVELQVTCDSGKTQTPWVVKSSDTIGENTTVTVGSCIDGRVKDVAQVKEKDIDASGIVLCSESNVCYHLKWISGEQIEVKNCDNDNDGDPICNYICDGNSFTRKGEAKPDGTDREEIKDNIICDGSTNNSYIYKCDGNIIVRKTHCPNGCADDNKGCKLDSDLTDKCRENDTRICKGDTLFECRNGTYIKVGKACNDKGEVVFCDGNELKQEMHTCANDKVVFCKDNSVKYENNTCAKDKVVWCKPNEPTPLQTECLPSSQNDNFIACKDLNKTRRICDENGKILPAESCSNDQTKCTGDLKRRVDCNNQIIGECQFCYNKNIENNFTSIGELGCDGCVPNEYKRKDSADSSLNLNDEVCYNGKFEQFGNAEGGNFLHVPKSNSNELWEFALNATLVQSEGQSETPPADQFVDTPNAPSKDHSVVPVNEQFKQTWRYYNCHNDAARDFLKGLINSDDANGFLKSLSDPKESIKCCDDENSYYITQTGYRYYSVEKCTNIRMQNTNNDIIDTNFSAYAYTPELNGSLIGVEDNLLAKDYACLEVRDNLGDTKAVRQMMFIKQQPDVKPKHGIYKAFECPEGYKCDEKLNRLCISNPPSQCNQGFQCDNSNNTITCDYKTIAACPKGTTLHIVGDDGQSSCEGQPDLTLDQIRCVPDSQLTSEQ